MSNNIVYDKSILFSVRIVNLYKHLCKNKNEYVMSKQLLRCGTSIGANLAEAQRAISKSDFVSKVYIALKECSETEYWLTILRKTDYISSVEFDSIMSDCQELLKILMATTKTLSSRNDS